jgi:caa(3)-type oxidase subunit IV
LETDGTRVTGHLKPKAYFWTTATLEQKKIESIAASRRFSLHGPFERTGGAQEGERTPAGDGDQDFRDRVCRLSFPGTALTLGFTTLTALHALHVLGGALVISYLWGPGARMWKTDPSAIPTASKCPGSSGTSSTWSGSFCSPFYIFSNRIMADTHSTHSPGTASAHSVEDIKKHRNIYLLVFGALLVGTFLTVFMYSIHFSSMTVTITIALFIATVKALLVAGFFMHLISEKKAIYSTLAVTLFFFAALMTWWCGRAVKCRPVRNTRRPRAQAHGLNGK